MLNSNKGTMWT